MHKSASSETDEILQRERDANRVIRSHLSFFGLPFPYLFITNKRKEQLLASSLDEKEDYIRKSHGVWLGLIAIVVVAFCFFGYHKVERNKALQAIAPVYTDIGSVREIRKEGAISVVRTSMAVVQVGGDVSAAIGDPAMIRNRASDSNGRNGNSLCIESRLPGVSGCYPVR